MPKQNNKWNTFVFFVLRWLSGSFCLFIVVVVRSLLWLLCAHPFFPSRCPPSPVTLSSSWDLPKQDHNGLARQLPATDLTLHFVHARLSPNLVGAAASPFTVSCRTPQRSPRLKAWWSQLNHSEETWSESEVPKQDVLLAPGVHEHHKQTRNLPVTQTHSSHLRSHTFLAFYQCRSVIYHCLFNYLPKTIKKLEVNKTLEVWYATDIKRDLEWENTLLLWLC